MGNGNTQQHLPPSNGPPSDPYADAVQVASIRHRSILRFMNTAIGHRIRYIRDTLSLAIPLLIGAVTFFAVAPELVKTPWLFLVAAGLLVTSILAGTIARSKLLIHLQTAGGKAEFWLIEVVDASRFAKYDPNDPVKRDRLINAETQPINAPNLTWFQEHSYKIVMTLFLMGLLGIAVAILARIQFS